MKVALIGIGRQGKRLLTEFSKKTDIAVCVSNGSLENSGWLKENFPAVRLVKNIEGIVADSSIEAVVIATPITTHFEIAQKMLISGKHVFLEKPQTFDAEESKILFSLAKEKKLVLFIGYTFLYSDVYQELKKDIAGKKIESVYFDWSKYGSFKENVLWNLVSHDLALCIDMLGIPNNNDVDIHVLLSKEDRMMLQLQYLTTLASFYINRLSPQKTKTVTVMLDSYTYVWQNDELFKIDNKTKVSHLLYQSKQSALSNECDIFLQSILSRTPIELQKTQSQTVVEILSSIAHKTV